MNGPLILTDIYGYVAGEPMATINELQARVANTDKYSLASITYDILGFRASDAALYVRGLTGWSPGESMEWVEYVAKRNPDSRLGKEFAEL